MSAADITFEPEEHTYWLGLERVPSVSEILRPLTETYLAAIPEAVLNWKRDLGIAVHKACELLDLGTLDEESLDERIVPYLEGYKAFRVDFQPQWNAIEQIVFDDVRRYAGTMDRAGELTTGPAIVDIKTSLQVQPSAAVQLWAYAMAHDEIEQPDLLVLQLLKDGTYKLVPFTQYDEYDATWNALLTLYGWKKRNER